MPAVVPEEATTQFGAVATCAWQDQGCLPSITVQQSTGTWARIDPDAKAFVTTKKGGPKWGHVQRRMAQELTSGRLIEDLEITKSTSEKVLHRLLPKQTTGTRTVLYHNDQDVTGSAEEPAYIYDSDDGSTVKHSNFSKDVAIPICVNTNYISDDENENMGEPSSTPAPGNELRRSKSVMQQIKANEKDDLQRITMLAAKETAEVRRLQIKPNGLSKGYAAANQHLQLDEWAYKEYFAGAIIDDNTGQSLEYRDLIKWPELRDTWFKSLANEPGRLAQGIRDIKGTDTILFIPKSEIPQDQR